MQLFSPRNSRQLTLNHVEELLMENFSMPEEGTESLCRDELMDEQAGMVTDAAGRERVATEATWRPAEYEPSLRNAAFTLELRGVKTQMVIAPGSALPVHAEGLLFQNHELPLSAEMEVVLTADDREIVRERFFLPTPRRSEVMDAHRELAKMSPDFLTNARLRDTAMSVYFPELSEPHDLWYRITVDENGLLTYALHMGPTHNQEVKKRIEGTLQL